MVMVFCERDTDRQTDRQAKKSERRSLVSALGTRESTDINDMDGGGHEKSRRRQRRISHLV